MTVLLTVFVASLVGSLHCVGMCGPFVAFYAGADGSGGIRRLAQPRRLQRRPAAGLRWSSAPPRRRSAPPSTWPARSPASSASPPSWPAAIMVSWGVLALLRLSRRSPVSGTPAAPAGRWTRAARLSAVADKPPWCAPPSSGCSPACCPAAGCGPSWSPPPAPDRPWRRRGNGGLLARHGARAGRRRPRRPADRRTTAPPRAGRHRGAAGGSRHLRDRRRPASVAAGWPSASTPRTPPCPIAGTRPLLLRRVIRAALSPDRPVYSIEKLCSSTGTTVNRKFGPNRPNDDESIVGYTNPRSMAAG